MSTARVDFTRGAAERIARAVRIVEQGERDQGGPSYGAVAESQPAKVLRVCTFTGSWAVNTLKTVTIQGQTATLSVLNRFVGLSPVGGADALVGRVGTAWHLVQPNLTQQPGYNTTGTVVMTLVNGSLRWVNVTNC